MREKPLADYPDIVNIDQLREMLGGVGYKAAYRLLHDGSIRCFKIGKAFRIPKTSVIEYLHEKAKIQMLTAPKIMQLPANLPVLLP